MDNKTVNKFNNVTCYLTSNTGNITVDAPFAGLPQYDINIAPTGITPGLYKPTSLLVSETGQIQAINEGLATGTQLKTNSLKVQTAPGEITLDLPDGVPLSISSNTLDVNPDAATGGYEINLLPNVVTSVSSTYPGLISGTIVDNELTLSPNMGIVTGVASTNNIITCASNADTPSAIDVTPSTSIVTSITSGSPAVLSIAATTDPTTGGTAIALNPSAESVASVVSANTALLSAKVANNVLTLTPNANIVTSVAVTPASNNALSASIANNVLTLAPNPHTVTSVAVTPSPNNPITATITGNALTIGYMAPAAPSIQAGYISVGTGGGGSGSVSYTNSYITTSSIIFITPVFPVATQSSWGACVIPTITSVTTGQVNFTWVTRNGNYNGTINFNILIYN